MGPVWQTPTRWEGNIPMLDSKSLSQEFLDWLDGYLEAFEGKDLTKEQTKKVSDRLNSVFHHEIDPEQDVGRNAEELRRIHSGTVPNESHPGTLLTEEPPDPLGGYDGVQRDMC